MSMLWHRKLSPNSRGVLWLVAASNADCGLVFTSLLYCIPCLRLLSQETGADVPETTARLADNGPARRATVAGHPRVKSSTFCTSQKIFQINNSVRALKRAWTGFFPKSSALHFAESKSSTLAQRPPYADIKNPITGKTEQVVEGRAAGWNMQTQL